MMWATSPRNISHCLDDGLALCGAYRPEPHDIRPSTPGVPRCPRCWMLMRPSSTKDAITSKKQKLAITARNNAIRAARRAEPDVTTGALAERFGCAEKTVWLALRRQREAV